MNDFVLKQNIYIVRNHHEVYQTNSLKLYLNILKQNKIDFNMKFSHCNAMTTLHRDITLRENFDLESLPSSITVRAVDETIKILSKIKNPHLKKMLSRITPLERRPGQLNHEEFILSSLCKSILKDSPYLFIDYPEDKLTHTNLKLVKDCLRYECQERGRTIMIGTNNIDNWLDISQGIISRTPDCKFNYLENQFKQTTDSQKEVRQLKIAA
jgi:ABC-type thiamine transport system ATPase subunit